MTTAAAFIDRLSNWLGSFIPGCGRLPPRHPVKVTLVMALLGLLSGWSSMLLALFVSVMMGESMIREEPAFLVTGLALSLCVAIPWAAWLGLRRRWWLLFVPFCIGVNYGSFKTIEPFNNGNQEVGLFLFGLMVGFALAAVGLGITRRFRPFWLAGTSLISAGGLCLFLFIKDAHLLEQWLGQMVHIVLIVGWFFSLLHTPLAICLGVLVWDRTPVPMMEADES